MNHTVKKQKKIKGKECTDNLINFQSKRLKTNMTSKQFVDCFRSSVICICDGHFFQQRLKFMFFGIIRVSSNVGGCDVTTGSVTHC